MKCIDGCHFLKDFHHMYYCDLYEQRLVSGDPLINPGIMRCKECVNGETLYHTRIKDAKKRVDNTKKTKRRR